MLRVKKFLAAGFAVALVSAGAVVVAAPVGAVTEFNPSAATPDGDTDSLRDVLENQILDGDIVNLEAGATYTLDDCGGGYVVIDHVVTINGNGATIEQTCSGERVLDVKQFVTINNTTITGGEMDGEGGGIYVDSDKEDSGELLLQGSTVTGNSAGGDGGGISSTGPVTIIDSTISDNAGDDGGGLEISSDAEGLWLIRSSVTGNCSEDDGGALRSESDAWVVNSTVTGNTFDDDGAIDMTGEGALTLVYSTIAANIHDDGVDCDLPFSDMGVAGEDDVEATDTEQPSNVGVGIGGLRAFGTVIALPIDLDEGSPGAFNCSTNEVPVVSSGYNYSDDDTCDLTDPTDKQNAADPLLGPLAANGGPTRTHLPQAGSPLIDAIPLASCSGGDALAEATITTDQRSLVRPDVLNQKCDIGAVEVQTELPVVIEPTFTG